MYVPGKPAASVGGAGSKLSSNEKPYPPAARRVEALTAAAGKMNRYPDPHGRELTDRLAEHLAVTGDLAKERDVSATLRWIVAELDLKLQQAREEIEQSWIVTRLPGPPMTALVCGLVSARELGR